MTPDLLTLTASVVALPGWRWMPGMLTTEGDRVWGVGTDLGTLFLDLANRTALCFDEKHGWRRWLLDGSPRTPCEPPLPDFTDAATGGCMLAMLDGQVGVAVGGDSTMVAVDLLSGEGATLAEACARVALARGRWA